MIMNITELMIWRNLVNSLWSGKWFTKVKHKPTSFRIVLSIFKILLLKFPLRKIYLFTKKFDQRALSFQEIDLTQKWKKSEILKDQMTAFISILNVFLDDLSKEFKIFVDSSGGQMRMMNLWDGQDNKRKKK